MLVAEHAERAGRRGRGARRSRGRQLDPARAEHAQHVAVGEDRDRPVAGAQLGDHAVGAGAHLRRRSRRPGSRRATGSSRAAALVDLRRWSGPRSRRSPTRSRSSRICAPARRGRTARRFRARAARGCTSTSSKLPARAGARRAPRRPRGPRSVRGMSVRPVWRPARLHSVSAWRTSTHLSRSPWPGALTAAGAGGAAASSTITVRRSRRSRLAGTWRLGSPSIAADRVGLARRRSPAAGSRARRAARRGSA